MIKDFNDVEEHLQEAINEVLRKYRSEAAGNNRIGIEREKEDLEMLIDTKLKLIRAMELIEDRGLI